MNIALLGYGKMGREIEAVAKDSNHSVKAIIDPSCADATCKEISADSVKGADVCIDFTQPECALENIRKLSALKKNIVIGTTGWHSQLDEAKKIVKGSGTGLVYAANFSVGVNLFYRIVGNASKMVGSLDDYDVLAYELHHKMKKDSPSGTAKSISEIIMQNFKKKKKVNYGMLNRQPENDELHFASVRGGSIPGTHTVLFDSQADTIELTHTARNRRGFASGAILAAEWLKGKKGFYNFSDIFDEFL